MTFPAPHNLSLQHFHLREPQATSTIDEAFLSRLVAELDNDTVTALILGGSYARGDATFYSDVDFARFVKESGQAQPKQFFYRDKYLISVATQTISQYHEWLTLPEQAIFVVPSLREARILLDKEGAFRALQQEAQVFSWEPLQEAADYYAGNILMEYTEYVHKILRALLLGDALALSEITLELFLAVTDALAIQRGVFITSGNTYFRQVEETVGLASRWTHYHRVLAGVGASSPPAPSLEAKGITALRLYQETVRLLQPSLHPLHRSVVEQTARLIDEAVSDK